MANSGNIDQCKRSVCGGVSGIPEHITSMYIIEARFFNYDFTVRHINMSCFYDKIGHFRPCLACIFSLL